MVLIISIIIVLFILSNLADHFDLTEGNYGWCKKWWHYLIQYLVNVFFGCFTQSLNSLTGGHPNESFSSRVGRHHVDATQGSLDKRRRAIWSFLYHVIGLWFYPAKMDVHHCRRRIENLIKY